MKKKSVVTLVTILPLIAAMIFLWSMTACITVTNTADQTVTGGVIELKYAYWNPADTETAQIDSQMIDRINLQCRGRLVLKGDYGESLVRYEDQYKGVQLGIADLGFYAVGMNTDSSDLNLIMNLPFMGISSMVARTNIYKKLLKDFPELGEQWEGVKLLGISMFPPSQLMLNGKSVRSPQDLYGLRIIANPIYNELLYNFGAVPLNNTTSGDITPLIKKGIANGAIIDLPNALMFSVFPVIKYVTVFSDAGCDTQTTALLMNLKRWNSLPSDIQTIIQDAANWRAEQIIALNYADTQKAYVEILKEGQTVNRLTRQELSLWIQAAKPIHDDWIAGQELQGLPAKAIYDEAEQLIDDYSKGLTVF